MAQLGGRDGRLLTGGTGADDGKVVGVDDDHSFAGRRYGYAGARIADNARVILADVAFLFASAVLTLRCN